MQTVKLKVAAVVVLFHPSDSIYSNIQSYINDVERIFLIDNSATVNHEIKSYADSQNKIEYLHLEGNLGIARALNKGAELAINNDFTHILTMDQDSRAFPSMVVVLKNAISKFNLNGLLSPQHLDIDYDEYQVEEVMDIIAAKTSGNILSLEAFKKIGNFNEEYFIDYVDIEYCFRLIKNGFDVVQVRDALLMHREANKSKSRFIGLKICLVNHSALRMYYKSRNRLYLKEKFIKDFPEYFQIEKRQYINQVIKIILFEKDKFLKIKSIINGIMHFKKRIKGKINLADYKR